MSPARRYARFVQAMGAAGAAAGLATLIGLRAIDAELPWPSRLAIGAGVFLTMLTAGALMGLAFLSSRSGHDRAADRRDQDPR
jgi:hypothetical protein